MCSCVKFKFLNSRVVFIKSGIKIYVLIIFRKLNVHIIYLIRLYQYIIYCVMFL